MSRAKKSDTSADDQAPARPGCLRRLLMLLLQLAVVAGVAVLGWGIWSNWERKQGFSLDLLDRAWWTSTRSQAEPVATKGAELVEQGQALLKRAYTEVWGQNGLVEQAEQWWKQRQVAQPDPASPPSTRPGPESAPAPEKVTRPDPAVQQCEQQFRQAEALFEEGLAAYRQSDPSQGWTSQRKAAYLKAVDRFTRVRDLLTPVLERYSRLPNHDPAQRKQAEAMLHHNQQLLYAAKKHGVTG